MISSTTRLPGGTVLLAALAGFGASAISAAEPQQTSPEPRARVLAREISAMPRLAGTTGSEWGASIVARRLTAAGFQVELDRREVLLSMPHRVGLEIYEDATTDHALERRVETFDSRARPPGDVPMFNAWSASAEVRAPVVDAGYGTRQDFDALAAKGVDVRGKVALVRYGKGYRGGKVERASARGAVAVLIFSDPADDGDLKGPVWPAGPWKPDTDAQRGSILPVGRAPGDPSTPGYASPAPGVAGVERRAGAELAAALPTIPCLPIPAREARAILAHLAERGPGPVEVRVAADCPRELYTIVNVIATLPGASEDFVLAGGHRDAWVRGMNDNGSGAVALMLAAEHLGARARTGWKPRSTIRIALWDAEEFGLIGSTEWGEAHAQELAERLLLYVNCDAACDGTSFGAGGSPGLLGALRRTLERLPAPPVKDGVQPANLWEQWSARFDDRSPRLNLPGSGSDDAVFAHHLGVPVLGVGFGGNSGGQYHTRFDDFAMVDRFLDPGWIAHGLCGDFLAAFLADTAELGPAVFDEREAAREMARRARDLGREGGDAPCLTPERAEELAAAFERLAAGAGGPALGARRFYVALAEPQGLAGRDWFRNGLWSPERENGYGAETFPALRAAARADDAELARALAALIARVDALARERAPASAAPEGGARQ